MALERKEHSFLKDISVPEDDISFCIGPEGGFSEEEVNIIEAHKFLKPISLGNNILRAETAGIVCLSWIAIKI